MARRTKVEAAATRQTILDAALKLFLEKGIARTTLEEIARAAGHTRGAVYHHFQNKGELLVAMKDSVMPPLEHLLNAHVNAEDPLKGVQQAVTLTLEHMMSDKRAMQVHTVFMHRCEFVEDMNPVYERECQMSETLHVRVTKQFALAQERGLMRKDITPDNAGYGLHALVHGMLAVTLRQGPSQLPQLPYKDLLDIYFRGLRA